jgi:hypothetical protein
VYFGAHVDAGGGCELQVFDLLVGAGEVPVQCVDCSKLGQVRQFQLLAEDFEPFYHFGAHLGSDVFVQQEVFGEGGLAREQAG